MSEFMFDLHTSSGLHCPVSAYSWSFSESALSSVPLASSAVTSSLTVAAVLAGRLPRPTEQLWAGWRSTLAKLSMRSITSWWQAALQFEMFTNDVRGLPMGAEEKHGSRMDVDWLRPLTVKMVLTCDVSSERRAVCRRTSGQRRSVVCFGEADGDCHLKVHV
jgi:hypothetical protein